MLVRPACIVDVGGPALSPAADDEACREGRRRCRREDEEKHHEEEARRGSHFVDVEMNTGSGGRVDFLKFWELYLWYR